MLPQYIKYLTQQSTTALELLLLVMKWIRKEVAKLTRERDQLGICTEQNPGSNHIIRNLQHPFLSVDFIPVPVCLRKFP